MSKPASSISCLMSLGEISEEWVTVTACETMETLIDIGAGLRDESVSSMVCTQLEWGSAVFTKRINRDNEVPCTMKIRDEERGDEVTIRSHSGMEGVDKVGGHKPTSFKCRRGGHPSHELTALLDGVYSAWGCSADRPTGLRGRKNEQLGRTTPFIANVTRWRTIGAVR